MPPKRKKRYTQKQKKRTGRKQKNTTFKNTAQVGGRKSLEDALSEKLTDELVQKLIDYPDRKYSILIDFCSDNSFVVNTMKLLDESSLASEGVYTPYNNKLTISNDFEQGKLLEIIIKVDKDVIQYATTVKEKNESDNKFCIDENLPVIYHIPEITTLDDKDLLSSTTLAPSISDEQPSGEVGFNNAPRDPMSYDNKEITSPDFIPEQAQINMNDLVVEDLEDVSDSYIDSSVTAPSDDLSKELETKIDRLAHEARLRAEEEAQRKAEEEAKRKAEEDAKKKAQEEAKRKAEEDAKKKAEEEAKRKAEEDAKKKADEEAKKKAEEDAKKKADEETRLKAEEDAKKKADDEAKKKADDEAKKKAEEDAKRKVEEEAKRKVEEETKLKAEEEKKRHSDSKRGPIFTKRNNKKGESHVRGSFVEETLKKEAETHKEAFRSQQDEPEDEPEDDLDLTAITERIEEDDETKVEFIANIAALQANVIDAAVREPNVTDTIHKLKSDIIKSWNTGFIKDTIIKTIGEENNTNLQNIFENVLCRLYPFTFGKYEAPLSEGIFGYGEGSYNTKYSHTVDAIEGINYYLGTLINDKLNKEREMRVINDVSTFINDFKKKDGFNYIEGCHTSELVNGKCPVDTLKCKNADENTKEATTIIADFENIGARLKTNQYNEKKSFSKDFVRIDGKLQAFIQHINNKGLTTNLAKIKTNISSKHANDDIQPIFIKQNIELLKKFIENYVSEKSKTQGGKKTRKNRRKTKQRKTKRRA